MRCVLDIALKIKSIKNEHTFYTIKTLVTFLDRAKNKKT